MIHQSVRKRWLS